MTNAQSSIRQRLFRPDMSGNLLRCWFGFFNWKLSRDICTRKEKLLLDSEKFLFSWWELVSGIRYFPPLQTQAKIMTTNMMGPSIVRDVYHMCTEANVNFYHMCIQRSREATTPVSKIHNAKKGKRFTAIICKIIFREEGEKASNNYFWKYSKNGFRVEGEKESNDYGQGSKK